MANDLEKKNLANGNNGEGNPNPNPEPPKDESKNEKKEEESKIKTFAKKVGKGLCNAGKFLWENKGKVLAIFGTGVATGLIIANSRSGGSSEATGTADTEILTGTVETPLMPDVDSAVNVDVDVDPVGDVVEISDYMNNNV